MTEYCVQNEKKRGGEGALKYKRDDECTQHAYASIRAKRQVMNYGRREHPRNNRYSGKKAITEPASAPINWSSQTLCVIHNSTLVYFYFLITRPPPPPFPTSDRQIESKHRQDGIPLQAPILISLPPHPRPCPRPGLPPNAPRIPPSMVRGYLQLPRVRPTRAASPPLLPP